MALSVNTQLRNLLLRRQVERVQAENACVREVVTLWRQLRQELSFYVRGSGLFTGAKLGESGFVVDHRTRLQLLLDKAQTTLWHYMKRVNACVSEDLPRVVEYELRTLPRAVDQVLGRSTQSAQHEEAQLQAEGLEGELLLREEAAVSGTALGIKSLAFDAPPVLQASELLTSPLGGAFFETSFGDLAQKVYRSLRNTLTTGLLQGQSVPQVARTLESVLGNQRWEAERIVRSEFVRAGNQAALLTYQQNEDLLSGVQWLSTLDQRTCLLCAKLDGRVWKDPAQAKIPVTNTHPNCRCTLVPVVKGAEALGLPADPGARASFDGQAAATVKYADWFKDQDRTLQREILGPTRYRLWRQGEHTLKDFAGTKGVIPVKDLLRRLSENRDDEESLSYSWAEDDIRGIHEHLSGRLDQSSHGRKGGGDASARSGEDGGERGMLSAGGVRTETASDV